MFNFFKKKEKEKEEVKELSIEERFCKSNSLQYDLKLIEEHPEELATQKMLLYCHEGVNSGWYRVVPVDHLIKVIRKIIDTNPLLADQQNFDHFDDYRTRFAILENNHKLATPFNFLHETNERMLIRMLEINPKLAIQKLFNRTVHKAVKMLMLGINEDIDIYQKDL